MGSGEAVKSNIRGPRFESSHQQTFFININNYVKLGKPHSYQTTVLEVLGIGLFFASDKDLRNLYKTLTTLYLPDYIF